MTPEHHGEVRRSRRRAPPSTGGRLRFRDGGTEDLGVLVAHRRAMWFAIGGHTDAELDAADPVYRRWLSARLRNRRAAARIAETRLGPVGSAVLWYRDDQPRPRAPQGRIPYILSVDVEPDHRGRGVAARLTQDLLDRARSEGYPRIVLHASRYGRSLYRRLGFARTWEMRFGGTTRRGHESRRPRDEPAAGRRRRRNASL